MADVLIACEYSGVVRDAFAKLGHNAVSEERLRSYFRKEVRRQRGLHAP